MGLPLSPKRRAGTIALAVSVGVHAAVLALAVSSRPRRLPAEPPAPQQTSLRVGLVSSGAPAAPAEPKGTRPPRARGAPARMATSRGVPVDDAAGEGSVDVGAGEEGGGSANAGAGAGGGAGAGVDGSALHARLAAAALRCYPKAAQRYGLTGEAAVRLCLTHEGTAAGVELVHSSGSTLLDQAALDCVIPGALPLPRGSECFRLPVRFQR